MKYLSGLLTLCMAIILFSCDIIPDTVPPDNNPSDPENPESIYNASKLPAAGGIDFFDTDTTEDIITGTMTVAKAADESAIDGYRLYWGSDASTKLSGAPVLKEIAKTGSDLSLTFGGMTAGSITSSVPSGTSHILVYTYYDDQEAATPYAWDIEDRVIERLADMVADSNDSFPQEFTVFNSKLYFCAKASTGIMNFNLWEYDSTKDVTMASGDQTLWNPRLIPVNGTSDYSNPNSLTVANNYLYFVGDSSSASNDNQLISINSSNVITVVTDVADVVYSSGTEIVPFTEGSSQYIFFRGFNTTVRNELFRTNNYYPPSGNTANVIDLYPGANDGYAAWLTLMDGRLYFSATDGSYGKELWSYDGTASPTAGVNVVRHTDINTGANPSSPQYLTVYDGKLYFSADDSAYDTELYCWDGSDVTKITSGTHSSGSIPVFLKVISGSLYFTAWDDDDKRRLWKYDGTGTPEAIIFPEEATMNASAPLVEHNGDIYFEAYDTIYGVELWCYDGNEAYRAADINAGTGNGLSSSDMASYNGSLYFAADDGYYGEEIWVYRVK